MTDESVADGGTTPEPKTDEAVAAGGTTPEPKKVNVWMILAIVAIVVALIAGYFALTYKRQVDDWEAVASETVAALEAAGIELKSTVESGVAGYEEQVSDLSGALEQSQTQAETSAAELEEAEQQLADAQAAQEDLQQELEATQQELAAAQTALDDANAQLQELGELVLPNGTYVGLVLGARTEPLPAIIFQEGTAWRVAEVSSDVTITAGEQNLTLEEFSALLQSTDPAAAELANGTYQVVVRNGLVQSIRTPAS
jgi:hypothetical protein